MLVGVFVLIQFGKWGWMREREREREKERKRGRKREKTRKDASRARNVT